MRELLPVRIGLACQLASDIELEVIAVGRNQGIGESDVFIAARPVKGGRQDNLFVGIALRTVKARGWLGFAEDVGDAVIADAVARAEVGVGVVVGLAGSVQLMRQGVGAGIEVVVVAGLVDAHAPQDDGGVIPVAANHAADVIDGDVLPGKIADVLPAGNLFQNQKTDLVAGVEEVAGLRVVRGADDIAMQVLAQDQSVLALHACGHGLADPWECLMAIKAAQLDDCAVEREALRCEAGLSPSKSAASKLRPPSRDLLALIRKHSTSTVGLPESTSLGCAKMFSRCVGETMRSETSR